LQYGAAFSRTECEGTAGWSAPPFSRDAITTVGPPLKVSEWAFNTESFADDAAREYRHLEEAQRRFSRQSTRRRIALACI